MTQKVITLVRIGDKWRLKTPTGVMLDAFFRGNKTDATDWATKFVSSWYNWIIQLEEDNDETQGRLPK